MRPLNINTPVLLPPPSSTTTSPVKPSPPPHRARLTRAESGPTPRTGSLSLLSMAWSSMSSRVLHNRRCSSTAPLPPLTPYLQSILLSTPFLISSHRMPHPFFFHSHPPLHQPSLADKLSDVPKKRLSGPTVETSPRSRRGGRQGCRRQRLRARRSQGGAPAPPRRRPEEEGATGQAFWVVMFTVVPSPYIATVVLFISRATGAKGGFKDQCMANFFESPSALNKCMPPV